MKHKRAIDILAKELIRLGGIVFARHIGMQNKESKKLIEASDFLESMITGKIDKKKESALKKYLDPMWEINTAIEILKKDKKNAN